MRSTLHQKSRRCWSGMIDIHQAHLHVDSENKGNKVLSSLAFRPKISRGLSVSKEHGGKAARAFSSYIEQNANCLRQSIVDGSRRAPHTCRASNRNVRDETPSPTSRAKRKNIFFLRHSNKKNFFTTKFDEENFLDCSIAVISLGYPSNRSFPSTTRKRMKC